MCKYVLFSVFICFVCSWYLVTIVQCKICFKARQVYLIKSMKICAVKRQRQASLVTKQKQKVTK